MKKNLIVSILTTALLGSPASQLCAQTTLYGVTAFDHQLVTVNISTGAGVFVGDLGSSTFAYGVAALTGNLYVFDQTSGLILPVNPTTGATGSGINIGVGAIAGEGDLAFRSDGIGFLASVFDTNLNTANNLYTFNIRTGTSTLIGSTGVSLDGLAFNGSTLYAMGQNDGMLYTVNQLTGALTAIGLPGIAKNSPFGAITFAPNGTLYEALDDSLYTINTTTGFATAIGSGLGFNSVSGLAFFSPAPEPGAASLSIFGGLLLLIALLKKNKADQA